MSAGGTMMSDSTSSVSAIRCPSRWMHPEFGQASLVLLLVPLLHLLDDPVVDCVEGVEEGAVHAELALSHDTK